MKNSTQINGQVQKELTKKFKSICLVLTVIGILGVVGYIVSDVLNSLSEWADALKLIAIFCLSYGLVCLILLKITEKKAANLNTTNEYEFLEDYILAKSLKNNEEVATEKLYYKDIYKVKETNNYIFIYKNKATAFPLDKSNNTSEELSQIKQLINKIKE